MVTPRLNVKRPAPLIQENRSDRRAVGRSGGIRTHDPFTPSEVRYQAALRSGYRLTMARTIRAKTGQGNTSKSAELQIFQKVPEVLQFAQNRVQIFRSRLLHPALATFNLAVGFLAPLQQLLDPLDGVAVKIEQIADAL